jgi:ABC-type branched-subunit amino acid transport system permease subunit
MGREALAANHKISAAEHLCRAAVTYHFAKYLFVQDMDQMRTAHMKAVECLDLALPHLDPPGERVLIPYEGKHLVGTLRKPKGVAHTSAGYLLFAALTLFLTRHNAGVALRALHQNPDLLRAYGLSSTRLSLLAFALGSALAAPAAMVTAMTSGMNEAIGHQVMLISMAATIVGGVGSLRGAALAGLMLGVAESVALNFVDTQWAEAVSFLVLFAFIIFRPSGIFGIAQAR